MLPLQVPLAQLCPVGHTTPQSPQFCGSLEVSEQPDLFQHFHAQLVGFIDDQRRYLAFPLACPKEALKPDNPLRLAGRNIREAEVDHRGFQKLRSCQRRIHNDAGSNVSQRRMPQNPSQQGCLAGAGRAGQDDETLARQNGVGKPGQRLAMLRRQVQKLRIGRQSERVSSQTEERVIHECLQSVEK